MNKKMLGLFGGVLILIALILGAVQHFNVYNLYGAADFKWYFWGLVGVIGLIGIVLAVLSYSKK